MNKFGFAKSGSKKIKENRGIGYNKSIEGRSGESSVDSGSSYGSASSNRSAAASLAMASTLTSLDSQIPATARPQIPARGPTTLPPPCHLNCQCDSCKRPNSDFLDGLLQLSPSTLETPAAEDPLASLLGDMADFSLEG